MRQEGGQWRKLAGEEDPQGRRPEKGQLLLCPPPRPYHRPCTCFSHLAQCGLGHLTRTRHLSHLPSHQTLPTSLCTLSAQQRVRGHRRSARKEETGC